MNRAVWLIVVAAVAGCGSANDLSGSVSEIYPLDFDSVDVLWVAQPPTIAVSYDKASGAVSKAAKLTVDLTGWDMQARPALDLSAPAMGQSRATVQRVQTTGTISLIVESGSLTLDGPVVPGANLGGHFHATFSDPLGRTLNGDFLAAVAQ